MNQQGYNQNPFAGMTSGDQSIGVRYPYLEDGDYKLKIHKTVVRGRQKPFYIIEHEVIESNVPSRPPGMRCCSFIDLSNKDMRGKNVTGFLCAVFGVDPTQLPKDSVVAPWVDQNAGRNVEWAEYANWSVQENNPLAGAQVGCRVVTVQTQATGDDFSVHQWVPMSLMTIGPVVQRAPKQPQLPSGPAPAGAANWGPPGAGQMPQQPQGGGWGPPGGPAGQPQPQPPQQPQGPAFGPPGGAPGQQPAFGPPAGGGGYPAGPPTGGAPNFGPPAPGGFGPGPGGPGAPPQGGFGGTPWGGGR